MKKVCNVCFLEKEQNCFYENKGGRDGYQKRCKDCTKAKTKERLNLINSDPELAILEKERHRLKYHRLYRTTIKDHSQVSPHKTDTPWHLRFPEKKKIHSLSQHVSPLIKGNHLHHWSYSVVNAKSVIELSRDSHYKAHAYLIYDQEHYLYRTLKNELLDTKEKHVEYLQSIGIEVVSV